MALCFSLVAAADEFVTWGRMLDGLFDERDGAFQFLDAGAEMVHLGLVDVEGVAEEDGLDAGGFLVAHPFFRIGHGWRVTTF